MNFDPTRLVPALRHALGRHGGSLSDEAALELLRRVGGASGPTDSPLAELGAALRGRGLTVEGKALTEVAWALLGVGPGRVRLDRAARSRLTHLVELHDVSLPSRARELGGQFAREAALVPDLRRVRPWLGGVGGTREGLAAIFETEWSGFLALLGEFGPWVYVPSVADLQTLSRHYAALVGAASGAGDVETLDAALRLHLRQPEDSLLVRLAATDYRVSPPTRRRSRPAPVPVGVDAAHLVALEENFWAAARAVAQARRDGWATRTRQGR